jgi:hypothetical protein
VRTPSPPPGFAISKRHPFTAQSEFGLTSIEPIGLPLKSRDERPPIVTGRTGLDLGQILVLGILRLGLDANYDRRFGHQPLRDNVARL